jgi:hypothetical protein
VADCVGGSGESGDGFEEGVISENYGLH